MRSSAVKPGPTATPASAIPPSRPKASARSASGRILGVLLAAFGVSIVIQGIQASGLAG